MAFWFRTLSFGAARVVRHNATPGRKTPSVRAERTASAVQHVPACGWESNVAVSMEKLLATVIQIKRSEERRVGKECA